MHRRTAHVLAALCVSLAGCGLPPIINGAQFLILSDSGTDIAQLDFPDQAGCMASQRADAGGASRCQRRTMWDELQVNADADLPNRTRVGAHFRSMSQCQQSNALTRIGATVFMPCSHAAPKR